ncbi:MAG: condensation domain-containing protein, partial [Pyrinomonadaceae bacterium]
PRQVVEPASGIALPVTDLSHLAEAEREAEATRLAGEEARLPFDLSRGPLLRAQLLRLGEEEHVALLTMHHIVSDGWSMGVLVREVAALYEAYSEGRESPLAELPVQYADYAVWQRGWLTGEVLERQLSYWRRQLGGALPVIELPTDGARGATPSHRGAAYTGVIEAGVADSLRELSRQEGVTLYMTMLAAFQLLLSRYTGLEDVPVGTAVANRTRGETESLIGFFVNTLVMRGDLSGEPTFRELIKRVREVCLGAYAHQETPFERLVEELQPERAAGRTPLVQVAFGVQNTAKEELTLKGLSLSGLGGETEAGRFELTVWVSEREDGGLGVRWCYDPGLYGRERVERMQRHFGRLLEGAGAEPEARLSSIEMLTEEERERRQLEEQEALNSNAAMLKNVRRKSMKVTMGASS